MPRSLKIVIACDNCHEEIEEEQHDGALTLTINGGVVKQIDLCHQCFIGYGSDILPPLGLVRLYEEADAIPETRSIRRGATRNTNQSVPSKCPVCDHVAGSAQGLGRHTRSEHGATVAELRGKS